jgi:anti-sigma B factor antagonist
MSCTITLRERDGVTVIDGEGRITLAGGTAMLRTTIQHLLKRDVKKIVLNLTQISYLDSTGICELTSSYTTITNKGGQLALLGLNPRVEDLLRITKLYTIFNVFADEDKAIKSFD